MSLVLNYTQEGAGPPLVILHGLFGSSKNWTRIARELAGAGRQVFCLDQRNHGDSPHAPTHTLADLSSDLADWLTGQKITQPVMLGHSMGGMAAMDYALRFPANLGALIVVDIAPRAYPPHHQRELAALGVDLDGCRTREEVDERMSIHVPDLTTRQFLQMNLARRDAGFFWKINVPVLRDSAYGRAGAVFTQPGTFDGPVLFVRGGESSYVPDEDRTLISARFPRARVETVAGAGHWLHYTHASQFLTIVREFLAGLPARP